MYPPWLTMADDVHHYENDEERIRKKRLRLCGFIHEPNGFKMLILPVCVCLSFEISVETTVLKVLGDTQGPRRH